MKARVKATGKIIEVKSKVVTSSITGEYLLKYVDQETGVSYFEEELFFPKDLADNPDYWERLKHQYAGMFLQAQISYGEQEDLNAEEMVEDAMVYAHTLVEKLKKKEERK